MLVYVACTNVRNKKNGMDFGCILTHTADFHEIVLLLMYLPLVATNGNLVIEPEHFLRVTLLDLVYFNK